MLLNVLLVYHSKISETLVFRSGYIESAESKFWIMNHKISSATEFL